MGLIKIFLDRQNRRIISINGGASAVPDLFQSNLQDFEITIIDPTGVLSAPYNYPNLVNSGLRVSLGDTPAGTTGQIPLALSTAWTWTQRGNYFTFVGQLALNTSAIDTYLGATPARLAYFEINETLAGNRNTLYQAQVNIKAVVDELSSTVPLPATSYYTADEANNTFLKFQTLPGQTLTLVSPDGTKGIVLGCDDAGNFTTNPITL